MSEELNINVDPTETQNTDQKETVNPYEAKALEKGWKPKDQFEGDPAEWRDAREFLDRGELLDTIHGANRKVKQLENALKHFAELHKTVSITAYNKALKDLKARQAVAVENADRDEFEAVSREIDETQIQLNKEVENVSKVTSEIDSAEDIETVFKSFVSKNAWYETNPEAKEYADEQGQLFKAKNPNTSFQDMLNYVETKTKKLFKELDPNRKPAPQVLGNSRTSNGVNKKTDRLDYSEFSELELKIASDMARNKVVSSRDEYLRMIKESR